MNKKTKLRSLLRKATNQQMHLWDLISEIEDLLTNGQHVQDIDALRVEQMIGHLAGSQTDLFDPSKITGLNVIHLMESMKGDYTKKGTQ